MVKTISKETERRFILGLQGLWPGRRWQGEKGLREALIQCHRVQTDPIDVVGRNHDIVFASRVAGYRPEYLERLLYRERLGFEYGGTVSIYPRSMLRMLYSWVQNEGLPVRWERWEEQNDAVIKRVRAGLAEKGPMGAADYRDGERIINYRSSRLEGLALYVLWRRLEILVHHRDRGQKFYDLTERMFGRFPEPLTREQTIDEMAIQRFGWLGLAGDYGIKYIRTQEEGRGRSKITKRQIRQKLINDGRLTEVRVEGERNTAVLRSEDVSLLEEVASGAIPSDWKPLDEQEEAVFLGPLDIIMDRDRARKLFDFEYLWEIYKPASRRKWGYYVLPVLIGDRLVGRIEPVRDKATGNLHIARAWWDNMDNSAAAVLPLALGIRRFAEYLHAPDITLGDIGPPVFRDELSREIRDAFN